jgi:repressor LexA
MLTKKQSELLHFINQRLTRDGVSPSFDEMKEAVGLKSKSGIHRLITALEERGFIRRLPHRARALEVLKLPESAATNGAPVHGMAEEQAPFSAEVIEGRFGSRPRPTDVGGAETVSLPLYGRIAAGQPIEAVADNSNTIDLPASMIGRGEHFALEIQGDSMVEAGIHDGDIAICSRCDTADNGEIVVALVDDEDATLKRLRRKGDTVALEPANKDYETRIFGPDRVKVQGRLVGLYRHY